MTANKAKHEDIRAIESISGFRSYSFPYDHVNLCNQGDIPSSCSSSLLWKRRRRNWKRRDKDQEGNENTEEKLMSFAFTKIKDFLVMYVYIPYLDIHLCPFLRFVLDKI